MAWAGFTDDQLRQIKHTEEDDASYDGFHSQQGRPQHQIRPQHMAKQRQHQVRQKGRSVAAQRLKQPAVPDDIDASQRLSVPKKVQGKPQQRVGGPPAEAKKSGSTESGTQEEKAPPGGQRQRKVKSAAGDHDNDAKEEDEKEDKTVVHEIDEKEGISRELTNMEKRRIQQQEMEEENKRKKAMLARAVADRRKRADAETKKLKEIQKELTKTDVLISNDVSILRDKIEDASREYMAAQRRYEKAEAEFIAAKIDLHAKTEAKDTLTEHLYSIIQENELRKANKLEELMTKLELENLEEYYKEEKHDAAIQSNDVGSETQTVVTTPTAADSTQTGVESSAENATAEPVGPESDKQRGSEQSNSGQAGAVDRSATSTEVRSPSSDKKETGTDTANSDPTTRPDEKEGSQCSI